PHHHPLNSTPFPYTTLFRSPIDFPLQDTPDDVLAHPAAAVHSQPGVQVVVGAARRHFHRQLRGTFDVVVVADPCLTAARGVDDEDRKSTRLNSSHRTISYAV